MRGGSGGGKIDDGQMGRAASPDESGLACPFFWSAKERFTTKDMKDAKDAEKEQI